jgi:hypothetical protein
MYLKLRLYRMDSYLGQNIRWILNEFNKQEIIYVVLRNYEKLPEIGHDLDLVAEKKYFDKIKKILNECKDKFYWDDFLQIKLWESYINDFSIHVFKLFNYEKNKCLHIDFFGGHSIWSASAFSVEDLLKERVYEDFYYKINPKHEIVIRSMQLSCAIRDHEYKRVLKLQNILKRLEAETTVLDAFKTLPIDIPHDFYYLKDQNFHNGFVKFKHNYFIKQLFKKPFRTLIRFLERIRFRLKIYTYAIPGILIFIKTKSLEENMSSIKKELNTLIEGNIVSDFGILRFSNLREIPKLYKKLLLGGVIIIDLPFLGSNFNSKLIKNSIIKRFK